MKKTTASTFAILGLIALKPMSTYELAQEMRRNLHFFWRRAERGVYTQARRLLKDGLISEAIESTGRRERSIYSITPQGEVALAKWLASAPSTVALENETLLRLLFAPLARIEDLDEALAHAELEAAALLAFGASVREGYLAGKAPFQHLADTRIHVYLFLIAYAKLLHEWARATRLSLAVNAALPKKERLSRAIEAFASNPPENIGGRSKQ